MRNHTFYAIIKVVIKKSTLIKLHLYAGIFTSFYLVAFGFSALVMNHHIKLEHTEFVKSWKTNIEMDSSKTDRQLAEHIRDNLNIMGWLPWWEFKREGKAFEHNIVHMGRKYHVKADLVSGDLTIAEAPKGLLAVIHGLHFLNGNIPNAPLLIRSWAIYQWLTLFIMAISIVLGLWLWLKYNYQVWQGWTFGGLFIFIIIVMLLI